MKLTRDILWRTAGRKTATLLLIAVSTVTAFATLGDGKSKKSNNSLLNTKPVVTPGRFSLKTGYQYRGSQIINLNRTDKTITLNSLITYQKGHMTYIVPVKTIVNTSKVKFSLGIPQLNR